LKKTKTAAPRIVRIPSTTDCYLVVEGASYPVDCADLARTIGSGRWVGEGLVDAWADAAWAAILDHLALPFESVDRAAAQWAVKRFVQRLWIDAFEPTLSYSAFARMEARDAEVRAKYLAARTAAPHSADAVAVRGKRPAYKAAKVQAAYAPTKMLAKQKVRGQAKALLAFFKATRFAPATTLQAADGMVAAGLKTTTKPARIAAFYLCDWAKKGWLERRPCF
jgi:hypothetical protein